MKKEERPFRVRLPFRLTFIPAPIDPSLPSTAALLYGCLLDEYERRARWSRPLRITNADLGARLGIDSRTVRKNLLKLEEMDYLYCEYPSENERNIVLLARPLQDPEPGYWTPFGVPGESSS